MNDSVIDIFSLCRFFFKFGGNLTGRWYLHSPPSGKEGSPLQVLLLPEGGEWRILSTIKLLFS